MNKSFSFLVLNSIASLLLFCNTTARAQNQVDILSPDDKIEIICTNTGKSINRQRDLRSIDKVISNFGQADSSRVKEIIALGGDVKFLHYADNYFIVPMNKFSHNGFEINDNNFFVTINNSVKIQIGEKINPILQLISPKRNYTNTKVIGTPLKNNIKNIGKISLSYGYNEEGELKASEHWLVVYYDMSTMKIVRIFDYHAS